jgi:apolipoprotein N-acyltransferase
MPCTPIDEAKTAPAGAGASNFRLRKLWPWLAAIASGLLYAACFAPFDQSWLCWIALTPLLAAVWFGRSTSVAADDVRGPATSSRATTSWRRNLLLGYIAGLVFFTTTFYWLGSLGELFDNVFLRGLPLLLSIYLALHFAFWTWFAGFVRPKTFASSARNLICAALIAAAWVTHEWVRGWLFGGFGWNGLGIALHDKWPLIQIAEFTGVSGISFLIAFANVIALTTPLRLFHEARNHRMRPHWDINLTVLAIVALFVFGWRATQHAPPAKSMRVAAVQPGVAQQDRFRPESAPYIYSHLAELASLAFQSKPPDLMVWPESAVPGDWLDKGVQQFVNETAAPYQSDLLFGVDDVDQEHAYNAAVFISAQDRQARVYHKIHLVPFGEYVPLRHSFPLFAAIAGRWVPGDFNAGEEYSVFRLTNGRSVAPLICFEDTIGDLTRQFVARGADLLVNVTNDGWFLHSAGSQQHLANAIFRCVETRRPMVRAANTGVTCFVNEFGRVTQTLRDDTGNTFTEGILTGNVDVREDRQRSRREPSDVDGQTRERSRPGTGANQLTFYTRHGELFAQVCSAITFIVTALITFIPRRQATTK